MASSKKHADKGDSHAKSFGCGSIAAREIDVLSGG